MPRGAISWILDPGSQFWLVHQLVCRFKFKSIFTKWDYRFHPSFFVLFFFSCYFVRRLGWENGCHNLFWMQNCPSIRLVGKQGYFTISGWRVDMNLFFSALNLFLDPRSTSPLFSLIQIIMHIVWTINENVTQFHSFFFNEAIRENMQN